METVFVIVLYRVLYYVSSRYNGSTFLNHLQGFQFSRKYQVSWLILAYYILLVSNFVITVTLLAALCLHT